MNAGVSGIGVAVSSAATHSSRHLRVSPIRLAVLALILERPGYRYEIAQRFQRRFATAIPVTDQRVYQVIDDFLDAGLIEEMAHPESELARRRAPRQHYAGTAAGEQLHRDWLESQLREDPERSAMLIDILTTSVRDHDHTLRLLDIYEQAVVGAAPARRAGQSLQADLIDRERRLVGEARRRWIAYARERLGVEP